ncbi:MAG: hypothetical protein FJ119_12965 [Deltaproteobacteria bacterium]|nr:hypothetical protein [Deltaproteobacteria bacterium]
MLKVLLLAGLLGVLGAPVQGGAAESFDRLLAVVNDEIITQSEFNRYRVLATLGSEQNNPGPDMERQLLEQFVERKLLMQEARRLKITVRDQELDKAMQDILSRNKMTLRELQGQLEAAGLMIEDVRSAVRGELMTSELIGREVSSRVVISDAEMEKYYNENIRPSERQGARVRLKQILLQADKEFTPEQVGALQARAESIRAQIEAGAAFEKLASEYSQCPSAERGGDLGFFYKGQLLPDVEEVAFSLPENTVSPVIRSSLGFHVVVVTFRDAGDAEPGWKNHVRDIRPVLYSREFERLYMKWYSDLRSNAYIDIKY